MCGASPLLADANPPAAAIHPACRPMASSTKTFVEVGAMERTSSAASRVEMAMYLAAEPKTGQQSVTGRTLSTVLGMPMHVIGYPNSAPISDTFCGVSKESLPSL